MFNKAEQAFARLDRAAADIEAAAASARTAIDGDGRKTFADVSAAARDLREGLAEARVVIHRLDDAASGLAAPDGRSEQRRGGEGGVSTCSSRWWLYH